jgi:hypothetical protein
MAPSPAEIAAAIEAEDTARRAHEALEVAEGRVRRLGDNPDGAATALAGVFARLRREHPMRAVLHVLRLRVDTEFAAWERALEQASEEARRNRATAAAARTELEDARAAAAAAARAFTPELLAIATAEHARRAAEVHRLAAETYAARVAADARERANPAGVVLCRRCRVPMKLIKFAGETFWGCSRYPKCRQRLTYTGP